MKRFLVLALVAAAGILTVGSSAKADHYRHVGHHHGGYGGYGVGYNRGYSNYNYGYRPSYGVSFGFGSPVYRQSYGGYSGYGGYGGGYAVPSYGYGGYGGGQCR